MTLNSDYDSLLDSYSSPSRLRVASPQIKRALQQQQQHDMELTVAALMNKPSQSPVMGDSDSSNEMRDHALQVMKARHQTENSPSSESPTTLAANVTPGGAPSTVAAAKPPTGGQTGIPQYGLREGGQLPQGLTPGLAAGMIGRHVPFSAIDALAKIVAPRYESHPITGEQFVIMPDGKVHSIGQGIPAMGTFKAGEGVEVPTMWDIDKKTGKPYQKFSVPRSGDGPSSPQSQASPTGDNSIGNFPPSAFGSDFDRIKAGIASQKSAEEGAKETAKKAAEGSVKIWESDMTAAQAAPTILQRFSALADTYRSGNINGGPLEARLLPFREALHQFFPSWGLDHITAAESVNKKINFGLAAEMAKQLTSRPTQMEILLGVANNPGLQMNNRGSLYMISLMSQMEIQKQELGAMAENLSPQQIHEWPKIKRAYYKAHPLVSPENGTPLYGDGRVLDELKQIGGILNSPVTPKSGQGKGPLIPLPDADEYIPRTKPPGSK